MKPILIVFTFGLLINQAQACGIPGAFCSRWGAKACECNGGHLLECQVTVAPTVDGQGGETEAFWTKIRNCPVPAGGGLQCVDGACTS
ncbi:uncharacterized protein BO87DRAFT_446584 [Aspergillus neoniger CBS 115656]|uniref:Extracellular membrane protein CFEM domain-containing protein n=1 Tax=Aspergillus neoniger (strain CBS 115656) TaxID=1448310 RepID=A0A318Y874_ASPNB|nr:hypothetical protein BO87DRAFT_446584 [Aspergillus neoniger CBS 115656]PYH30114.1 hypothetical protein BO87DRAFT_446584 [Aspergillus neoniger CBS 115656]